MDTIELARRLAASPGLCQELVGRLQLCRGLDPTVHFAADFSAFCERFLAAVGNSPDPPPPPGPQVRPVVTLVPSDEPRWWSAAAGPADFARSCGLTGDADAGSIHDWPLGDALRRAVAAGADVRVTAAP